MGSVFGRRVSTESTGVNDEWSFSKLNNELTRLRTIQSQGRREDVPEAREPQVLATPNP